MGGWWRLGGGLVSEKECRRLRDSADTAHLVKIARAHKHCVSLPFKRAREDQQFAGQQNDLRLLVSNSIGVFQRL